MTAYRLPACLLLAVLLAACAAPQPRESTGPAATGMPGPALEQRAGDQAFPLVAADSRILVRVYPDGRLKRMGHRHVVRPRALAGRFLARGDGSADAEIAFALQDLRVDHPDDRALLGEDFAKPVGESAVAGTRKNMLGPVLEATRFPHARVTGHLSRLASGEVQAELVVFLHGVQARVPAVLQVEKLVDGYRVRGEIVLRQTDLGITPFSALGGALGVRDAMDIGFDLVARH